MIEFLSEAQQVITTIDSREVSELLLNLQSAFQSSFDSFVLQTSIIVTLIALIIGGIQLLQFHLGQRELRQTKEMAQALKNDLSNVKETLDEHMKLYAKHQKYNIITMEHKAASISPLMSLSFSQGFKNLDELTRNVIAAIYTEENNQFHHLKKENDLFNTNLSNLLISGLSALKSWVDSPAGRVTSPSFNITPQVQGLIEQIESSIPKNATNHHEITSLTSAIKSSLQNNEAQKPDQQKNNHV